MKAESNPPFNLPVETFEGASTINILPENTKNNSAEEKKEAQKNTDEYKTTQFRIPSNSPAEEKEFTALKEYVFDNGFTPAGIAMHVVMLCAQPMVTPATTNWDFVDRALIPDMVFALLKQPGYLEGIWPSLRIIMGSNKGNTAWSASIATTIAFFDTIRVLPTLQELQK